MPDPQLQPGGKPGVSKIVKLNDETLLVTKVENGDQVDEGPIEVRSIEAVPIPGGPTDAARQQCAQCGCKG